VTAGDLATVTEQAGEINRCIIKCESDRTQVKKREMINNTCTVGIAAAAAQLRDVNACLMLFRYKASWFVQFYVVLWRCALNNMREPAIFRTRLFQVTVSKQRSAASVGSARRVVIL